MRYDRATRPELDPFQKGIGANPYLLIKLRATGFPVSNVRGCIDPESLPPPGDLMDADFLPMEMDLDSDGHQSSKVLEFRPTYIRGGDHGKAQALDLLQDQITAPPTLLTERSPGKARSEIARSYANLFETFSTITPATSQPLPHQAGPKTSRKITQQNLAPKPLKPRASNAKRSSNDRTDDHRKKFSTPKRSSAPLRVPRTSGVCLLESSAGGDNYRSPPSEKPPKLLATTPSAQENCNPSRAPVSLADQLASSNGSIVTSTDGRDSDAKTPPSVVPQPRRMPPASSQPPPPATYGRSPSKDNSTDSWGGRNSYRPTYRRPEEVDALPYDKEEKPTGPEQRNVSVESSASGYATHAILFSHGEPPVHPTRFARTQTSAPPVSNELWTTRTNIFDRATAPNKWGYARQPSLDRSRVMSSRNHQTEILRGGDSYRPVYEQRPKFQFQPPGFAQSMSNDSVFARNDYISSRSKNDSPLSERNTEPWTDGRGEHATRPPLPVREASSKASKDNSRPKGPAIDQLLSRQRGPSSLAQDRGTRPIDDRVGGHDIYRPNYGQQWGNPAATSGRKRRASSPDHRREAPENILRHDKPDIQTAFVPHTQTLAPVVPDRRENSRGRSSSQHSGRSPPIRPAPRPRNEQTPDSIGSSIVERLNGALSSPLTRRTTDHNNNTRAAKMQRPIGKGHEETRSRALDPRLSRVSKPLNREGGGEGKRSDAAVRR